jgi:transcriptional regulator GlxA family with amidase domain
MWIGSSATGTPEDAGRAGASPERGGLACWQVRRSKEVMLGNIESNVSLARLAKECRLSKSQFGRAFKQTLGRPPHRWLLEQRVEKAKGLLVTPKSRSRRSPLAPVSRTRLTLPGYSLV